MKKLFLLIAIFASALSYAQVTPNLGLSLPPQGTQNWNVPMNQNFNLLDQYLSGAIPLPPAFWSSNPAPIAATDVSTATLEVSGIGSMGGLVILGPPPVPPQGGVGIGSTVVPCSGSGITGTGAIAGCLKIALPNGSGGVNYYLVPFNALASSGPLPTPPTSATNFSNLQSAATPSTWQQCAGSGCAGGSDTGTGSLVKNIATTPNGQPTLSGAAMKQNSKNNASVSSGYNVLYYRHLGCIAAGCNNVNHMLEDEWFYIPSSSTGFAALEFDPDIWYNGFKYFASLQCQQSTGKWRVYNTAAAGGNTWTITPYPCVDGDGNPLLTSTNKWHHFQLYIDFSIPNTGAGTYTYQTFLLDGVPVFQTLGLTYSAKLCPIVNGVSNCANPSMNIENQIDNGSGNNNSIDIYYDLINLSAWQ